MDRKTIQFATAQVILNSLFGTRQLVIYNQPLIEIENLCESIKKVIESYSSGIPEDLPVQIDTEVAQEIYLRCAKNDWSVIEKKELTQEERKEILSSISLRYSVEPPVKKHVLKELESEPNEFLLELSSLSDSDLTERLNEWTSYELEDLFDRVKQESKEKKSEEILPPVRKPKKPSKTSSSKKKASSKTPKASKKSDTQKIHPLLQSFIQKYSEQETSPSNQKRTSFRDSISEIIHGSFVQHQRKPLAYEGGKFPPSLKYIRNVFMPWLILTTNRGKTADILQEGRIYKKFLSDYQSGNA
jgi:hypothetical protein